MKYPDGAKQQERLQYIAGLGCPAPSVLKARLHQMGCEGRERWSWDFAMIAKQ